MPYVLTVFLNKDDDDDDDEFLSLAERGWGGGHIPAPPRNIKSVARIT